MFRLGKDTIKDFIAARRERRKTTRKRVQGQPLANERVESNNSPPPPAASTSPVTSLPPTGVVSSVAFIAARERTAVVLLNQDKVTIRLPGVQRANSTSGQSPTPPADGEISFYDCVCTMPAEVVSTFLVFFESTVLPEDKKPIVPKCDGALFVLCTTGVLVCCGVASAHQKLIPVHSTNLRTGKAGTEAVQLLSSFNTQWLQANPNCYGTRQTANRFMGSRGALERLSVLFSDGLLISIDSVGISTMLEHITGKPLEELESIAAKDKVWDPSSQTIFTPSTPQQGAGGSSASAASAASHVLVLGFSAWISSLHFATLVGPVFESLSADIQARRALSSDGSPTPTAKTTKGSLCCAAFCNRFRPEPLDALQAAGTESSDVTILVAASKPSVSAFPLKQGNAEVSASEVLVEVASKIGETAKNFVKGFFGFGSSSSNASNKKESNKAAPISGEAQKFARPARFPNHQPSTALFSSTEVIAIDAVLVDPTHHYAALHDSEHGRVYVLDIATGAVCKLFKGARGSQCAWMVAEVEGSRTALTLALYFSVRGVVELHSLATGTRLFAKKVGSGCLLLQDPTQVSSLYLCYANGRIDRLVADTTAPSTPNSELRSESATLLSAKKPQRPKDRTASSKVVFPESLPADSHEKSALVEEVLSDFLGTSPSPVDYLYLAVHLPFDHWPPSDTVIAVEKLKQKLKDRFAPKPSETITLQDAWRKAVERGRDRLAPVTAAQALNFIELLIGAITQYGTLKAEGMLHQPEAAAKEKTASPPVNPAASYRAPLTQLAKKCDGLVPSSVLSRFTSSNPARAGRDTTTTEPLVMSDNVGTDSSSADSTETKDRSFPLSVFLSLFHFGAFRLKLDHAAVAKLSGAQISALARLFYGNEDNAYASHPAGGTRDQQRAIQALGVSSSASATLWLTWVTDTFQDFKGFTDRIPSTVVASAQTMLTVEQLHEWVFAFPLGAPSSGKPLTTRQRQGCIVLYVLVTALASMQEKEHVTNTSRMIARIDATLRLLEAMESSESLSEEEEALRNFLSSIRLGDICRGSTIFEQFAAWFATADSPSGKGDRLRYQSDRYRILDDVYQKLLAQDGGASGGTSSDHGEDSSDSIGRMLVHLSLLLKSIESESNSVTVPFADVAASCNELLSFVESHYGGLVPDEHAGQGVASDTSPTSRRSRSVASSVADGEPSGAELFCMICSWCSLLCCVKVLGGPLKHLLTQPMSSYPSLVQGSIPITHQVLRRCATQSEVPSLKRAAEYLSVELIRQPLDVQVMIKACGVLSEQLAMDFWKFLQHHQRQDPNHNPAPSLPRWIDDVASIPTSALGERRRLLKHLELFAESQIEKDAERYFPRIGVDLKAALRSVFALQRWTENRLQEIGFDDPAPTTSLLTGASTTAREQVSFSLVVPLSGMNTLANLARYQFDHFSLSGSNSSISRTTSTISITSQSTSADSQGTVPRCAWGHIFNEFPNLILGFFDVGIEVSDLQEMDLGGTMMSQGEDAFSATGRARRINAAEARARHYRPFIGAGMERYAELYDAMSVSQKQEHTRRVFVVDSYLHLQNVLNNASADAKRKESALAQLQYMTRSLEVIPDDFLDLVAAAVALRSPRSLTPTEVSSLLSEGRVKTPGAWARLLLTVLHRRLRAFLVDTERVSKSGKDERRAAAASGANALALRGKMSETLSSWLRNETPLLEAADADGQLFDEEIFLLVMLLANTPSPSDERGNPLVTTDGPHRQGQEASHWALALSFAEENGLLAKRGAELGSRVESAALVPPLEAQILRELPTFFQEVKLWAQKEKESRRQ
jgi:hypothetical protein